MDILYAVLLMLFLAIVLSLVIVLVAKRLYVPEDPRVAAVEKMLPGYNCGACGQAGCHDMAAALVSGTIKKISTCKVGKVDKNFEPIKEYLAKTPGPDGKTVDAIL